MPYSNPESKDRSKRRSRPAIYVLAAGMFMCLLYLVSMSVWALTANITSAGDRNVFVSFDDAKTEKNSEQTASPRRDALARIE